MNKDTAEYWLPGEILTFSSTLSKILITFNHSNKFNSQIKQFRTSVSTSTVLGITANTIF